MRLFPTTVTPREQNCDNDDKQKPNRCTIRHQPLSSTRGAHIGLGGLIEVVVADQAKRSVVSVCAPVRAAVVLAYVGRAVSGTGLRQTYKLSDEHLDDALPLPLDHALPLSDDMLPPAALQMEPPTHAPAIGQRRNTELDASTRQ